MKSRRNFIKNTSLVTGGVLSSGFDTQPLSSFNRIIGANKKLNFGVIGCRGMGWSDMRSILKNPDTDCIAVCDVDDKVLEKRSGDVEKITGTKPKKYKDYRKLLEDKNIDAVVIGTPDHWHCLMLVHSLEAGKHVYLEKPISNSIKESNIMLDSAKKYNKIIQVNQWQRSSPHYREALDYLWSGKLGQIRLVKVWAYQGWYGMLDTKPDSPTPKGVDYKSWLGPAPMRPFNENRFHFNFRWYWDYAGGLMTDWGVHEIDIALFGMKVREPKSIVASGGRYGYPNQDTETPDTLQTLFEYDNFTMLWENAVGIDGGNYGQDEGIAFIGNNGTLQIDRGGWQVISEKDYQNDRKLKLETVPYQKSKGSGLDFHTKNFVEAIRNNDPNSLACGIDSGSIACINAHMGNISYKVGRKIFWDKESQNFGNDKQANDLISPKYNNGFKLPS